MSAVTLFLYKPFKLLWAKRRSEDSGLLFAEDVLKSSGLLEHCDTNQEFVRLPNK